VLAFADLAGATFVTLLAALPDPGSHTTLVGPFRTHRHTAVPVSSFDVPSEPLNTPLIFSPKRPMGVTARR
jgi:hypothetical protein